MGPHTGSNVERQPGCVLFHQTLSMYAVQTSLQKNPGSVRLRSRNNTLAIRLDHGVFLHGQLYLIQAAWSYHVMVSNTT